MIFTRQNIDNSLAIKQAEEFFKDWTFENINLDPEGSVMEDSEEPTVFLFAGTNTNGSECSCDMGYTITEWKNLTVEEQDQTIHEYMANVVDIWVAKEDGKVID